MNRRHRILLVDDDPYSEVLARRALNRCEPGTQLDYAKDGETALKVLASPTPLPDLVLLDLKMPRLTGIDVLKQIRSAVATRFLPVVILSSSGEDIDVLDSYESGASGYVQKPISLGAFQTALANVVAFWSTTNVPAPDA